MKNFKVDDVMEPIVLPPHVPGDGEPRVSVTAAELAGLLKLAKEEHARHEERYPLADHTDWPTWYARFIVAYRASQDILAPIAQKRLADLREGA